MEAEAEVEESTNDVGDASTHKRERKTTKGADGLVHRPVVKPSRSDYPSTSGSAKKPSAQAKPRKANALSKLQQKKKGGLINKAGCNTDVSAYLSYTVCSAPRRQPFPPQLQLNEVIWPCSLAKKESRSGAEAESGSEEDEETEGPVEREAEDITRAATATGQEEEARGNHTVEVQVQPRSAATAAKQG